MTGVRARVSQAHIAQGGEKSILAPAKKTACDKGGCKGEKVEGCFFREHGGKSLGASAILWMLGSWL
jgi:hypothetical protein